LDCLIAFITAAGLVIESRRLMAGFSERGRRQVATIRFTKAGCMIR
jgi:hypothetical protein